VGQEGDPFPLDRKKERRNKSSGHSQWSAAALTPRNSPKTIRVRYRPSYFFPASGGEKKRGHRWGLKAGGRREALSRPREKFAPTFDGAELQAIAELKSTGCCAGGLGRTSWQWGFDLRGAGGEREKGESLKGAQEEGREYIRSRESLLLETLINGPLSGGGKKE